jgi:hypothetical protein
MRFLLLVFAVVAAGCSSTRPSPPPWQSAPLTAVPEVYRTEFARAENRSSCALIAFSDTGGVTNATPRRANFSGGWAVAYDTTSQRSAFGIAGTGGDASGSTYQWANRRAWSDGSSVTWGLEGGTGPNHLAYLRIAGQSCLYNVWSALGQEHLEVLIEGIRFVR